MRALLDRHVELFNEGVRTGDFSGMLEQFSEEAELHFEGVPYGPFVGRGAIGAGYAKNPPDDEIDVLRLDREGESLVAQYAWRRDRGKPAGRMILSADDGRITRLVVTFD